MARSIAFETPYGAGFLCGVEQVYGERCICEMNGWAHEWGEAFPPQGGLFWCANCDCCVMRAELVDES